MNGINGLSNGLSKNGFRKDGVTYEEIKNVAEYVLSQTSYKPKVAIVCGSGLGGLADQLEDSETLEYKNIPHFPVSTVPGHAGRLVFGKLSGRATVCMKGRVHSYEGYPMWKITLPIRVLKLMGIEVLILTNAAGGLNPEYDVGDLMVIKDHINLPGLCGMNPLIGYNDERFGPRFPALSGAYDKELRQVVHRAAQELAFDGFVREGVYVMQTGPCFETVTECQMLRMMGADVTGMSTVPEVVVARHCGMRVLGMSLVTNKCIIDHDTELKANHEEVLETGRMRSKDMQKLITKVMEEMPKDL